MPYLLSACDIYAAPSRLEGFGMIQVEANACERPVIAIDAMAFRDTMVHGETAFLAKVAEERKITEALYGEGHDYKTSHRIVFPNPRTLEGEQASPAGVAAIERKANSFRCPVLNDPWWLPSNLRMRSEATLCIPARKRVPSRRCWKC
jgi:glycosyltransferase involved in cell wall biosynthesis